MGGFSASVFSTLNSTPERLNLFMAYFSNLLNSETLTNPSVLSVNSSLFVFLYKLTFSISASAKEKLSEL